MQSLTTPGKVVATPMSSEENLHFTHEGDQSGMIGGHSVINTDRIDDFQYSGLTAMKDHNVASRGKLSLASSGVNGFFKLLLSFKIAQTAADGAMFLHGRITKEPFHAKMDENLESVMHDMSKGNMANIVKFDPLSYISCMDSFVLGDSVKLPEKAVQELNRILIDILNKTDNREEIESDVRQFLDNHQDALSTCCLSEDVMTEIKQGNGIMTPRILIAKLINGLKASDGHIDDKSIKSFTENCIKTVEYYSQRTAMSLYAKSLANLQIMESATKKELANLDIFRSGLNKSTDFLMRTVPHMYIFIVANLIIDRNISGDHKTENFDDYMDKNFTHIDQTDRDEIKSFAGNYFTTNSVNEFGLKWGNLMPTVMAISLYALSTFRLAFNVVSPEKQETYVNQAMTQLLNTYKSMISPLPQTTEANFLPEEDKPGTSHAKAQMKLDPYQSVPNDDESANMEADEPPVKTKKDTDSIASSQTDKLSSETTSTQDVTQSPLIEMDSGEKVSLEEIARDSDKYNLQSSEIVRAYFNTLDGSQESKLEKLNTVFSGGLIGMRALVNVAYESKDSTPDVPARNWVYDNFFGKIIVPMSSIENRGVIHKMMSEQQKSRMMDCLSKVLDGQSLTADEEDFMQGVMDTHGKLFSCTDSCYGIKKNINTAITSIFMVFHLGLVFTDILTALTDPEGKSVLDPIFQQSMGLMNVGIAYKLFYRPILEVINMGTFAMQHGVNNISRYFMLAAWNVIGRSITSAPALPLWDLNTTNFDTLGTLVDSAGTTGHDQSTHTNLRKASLESNIQQAKSLLHIVHSSPELWERAFPTATKNSEQLQPPPEDDFAHLLSERLNVVSRDMGVFSQMHQTSQPVPNEPFDRKEETAV